MILKSRFYVLGPILPILTLIVGAFLPLANWGPANVLWVLFALLLHLWGMKRIVGDAGSYCATLILMLSIVFGFLTAFLILTVLSNLGMSFAIYISVGFVILMIGYAWPLAAYIIEDDKIRLWTTDN